MVRQVVKVRVAIVGGGPAGLTAALSGVKAGFTVKLWERAGIGENIRCAEGLYDPLGLVEKPKVGMFYQVKRVLLEFDQTYTVNTGKLNLWMMDRYRWQTDLASKAQALGAKIWEHSLIRREELAELTQKFDWVIDASGAGLVAGGPSGGDKAVCYQVMVESDLSRYNPELKAVFRPDLLGYFWIFPKSSTTANVGVDRLNQASVGAS